MKYVKDDSSQQKPRVLTCHHCVQGRGTFLPGSTKIHLQLHESEHKCDCLTHEWYDVIVVNSRVIKFRDYLPCLAVVNFTVINYRHEFTDMTDISFNVISASVIIYP